MSPKLKILLWFVVFTIVPFIISQFTQDDIQGWYAELTKPSFNPPNYVFAPVWGILYAMMACAGFYLWHVGAEFKLKAIFITYTLMNWAWTPIFFGFQQITIGFIWIVALSLVNLIFILMAWRSARLSAVLVIPLLAWTSFASVLSYYIMDYNT